MKVILCLGVNFSFELWFPGLFLVETLGLSLILVCTKIPKIPTSKEISITSYNVGFSFLDYKKVILSICGDLGMYLVRRTERIYSNVLTVAGSEQ